MKKLILTLSALVSLSSFASDCPSIDEKFLEIDHGFISHLEVLDAIECKLGKSITQMGTCNTRIGIKVDRLTHLERQYTYTGLGSLEEIHKARRDVEATISACEK